MKNLPFLLLISFSLQSYSQCRKTFLYAFELVGIPKPELVTATVFYKGKAIVPKTETICGKSLKIKRQFTYLNKAAKILQGVKVPYLLPANRFYWLMTDDMNIEMAINPDRFKIVLDTKDPNMKSRFEFPITYDFLSQNAIYLDLLDKTEDKIRKEFSDKVWKFSPSERPIEKEIKRDTLLVYSARKNIPGGILICFPELRDVSNIHSTKDYTAAGMLFNQKLFLKIPENTIPEPDAQHGLYLSLDGKKCATSGGITGVGFGECAVADIHKNKKYIFYQINIQIEP
jgi:hypothetical protein